MMHNQQFFLFNVLYKYKSKEGVFMTGINAVSFRAGSTKEAGVSTEQKKTEKKAKSIERRGSAKAYFTVGLPFIPLSGVSLAAGKGLVSAAKSLSPEQIEIMNTAADSVLKNSGLAAKGVEIKNVTSAGLLNDLLPGWLRKFHPMSAIAEGRNAGFIPSGKKNLGVKIPGNYVAVNRKKLPTAIFHELGHAFNFNNSAFWKTIQKMRMPGMILAGLITMYGALSKNSKAEEGKELTTAQKTNNFIRNNAGKLAFTAMLPTIAEETMASIRGSKWANKLLAPDLAKRVLKSNIFGGLSYVFTSLVIGLTAYNAVRIKNKAVNKADAVKAAAKQEAENPAKAA